MLGFTPSKAATALLVLTMQLMAPTHAQGKYRPHSQACFIINHVACFISLDSLRGVRYRNETVHDTLSHASMAGGMELYIDGSGMDEQPYINTVLFESVETPDSDFAGPAQDNDDQIQSSTTVGRLAYTLPGLPDLFKTDSMESFNQHFIANNEDETIGFELKIQNDADSTVVECVGGSESKCKVQYLFRYTPLLIDISPNNVYHE